jgi:hypothetical protein
MDPTVENTTPTRDWKALSKQLRGLIDANGRNDQDRFLSKSKQKYWESLLESGQDLEACEYVTAAKAIYQQVEQGLKRLQEAQKEEREQEPMDFSRVSQELEAFCYQDTQELLQGVSKVLPTREQEYFKTILKKSEQNTALELDPSKSATLEKPQLVGIRKKKDSGPKTREELHQIRADITQKTQHYQKAKKVGVTSVVSKDTWPEQVGAYNSLNTFSRVMDHLSQKDAMWVQDLYEYYGGIQELKKLFTEK